MPSVEQISPSALGHELLDLFGIKRHCPSEPDQSQPGWRGCWLATGREQGGKLIVTVELAENLD
jgi:hypothetical protein